MTKNIGGVRNSSEAFGFLSLVTLGSANSGYAVHYRPPKSPSATSDTRKTLGDMATKKFEGRYEL